MALKQRQDFTQNIMGGVRKNIEASEDVIESGISEELSPSTIAPVASESKESVKSEETKDKKTSKKQEKEKIERLIKKSVFFDYDTNEKLETIKNWKRFKEGQKRVSVEAIIYDATVDWLNRNFEKMEKKYRG